ncbi:hypothetical protein [Rothia mucilaginosa]|uniref:Uncharacterized protein n=1 Tax=Rothia dentocariosa TaxID=2047 RepID=A0A930PG91_9MICC|nr:hypothetical protein [Rothia mucilaginosa]MBF1650760.1 hypothetical protein [Rothia dentocariosa]
MENFDTNIDPNIPESRDRIAEWVKAVGDKAESQGLEVKSSLEFSTRSERNKSYAKITKFILASANRDQKQAMRDYQGYGVMLIGVTQNEVCGLEDIPEQHNFEDATRGYFGSVTPAYRFVSHGFEGKDILFVIVDPPVNGKEIYICSKEYRSQEKGGDQLKDGAIYCRESTQTIEANSIQMRGIIDRLLGGKVDFELGIPSIFSGPHIDNETLKNMYSQPKEKHAEYLREELIREELNGKTSVSEHLVAQVKALNNYEERLDECFERLLELKLDSASFSIKNTGTRELKRPCIEYEFPGNVYLVQLENCDYKKVGAYEVYPFLPIPADPTVNYRLFRPKPSSNFYKTHKPNVLVWNPGSVNPGQTITSDDENIGIFLSKDNDNKTVLCRMTDPNLRHPFEGEIDITLLNFDVCNIFNLK